MTAVLAAVGVATLVSGFIVIGTAGAVQADEEVPCGTPAQEAVYTTIEHPAEPAVYATVVVTPAKDAWVETITHPAVPAVYETVVIGKEYLWSNPPGQGNEDNPGEGEEAGNEERWLPQGESPPGNNDPGTPGAWIIVDERDVTDQRLVTPAKDAWTEVIPHAAQPEVTEQRLVSPEVPAWTEQKLVTPAVPAGPPCEDDETPPPPVKDVCTNLNGVQPDVPKGYTEQDGICTEIEVLPTEALDVCSNIKGAQAAVPAGLEAEDGRCVRPAEEKPDEVVGPDEVLGTAEAVPTAVDAGLGGPTVTTTSTSSPLGQGLVGAGVVMLLLAGSMQMGRARGAHQV